MTFVMAIGFRQMAVAQERVRDAQYRLNQQLVKYGAGSKEVVEAQRNLRMAQQNLTMSSIQFTVQMILMGTQILILISQLKALEWSALSAKLALVGIPGWGLVAGAAGAVALGGLFVYSQMNIQGATNDQIMAEYDRAKEKERRGLEASLG